MPAPSVDVGIMTQTLEKVLNLFQGGADNVQSGGTGLLSVLITIEIVWGGLMWSFTDATMVMRNFLKKLIFVGVFAFLVLNWTSVANTILDGFIWGGNQVAGGRVPVGVMRDPSRIVKGGLQATQFLWGMAADLSLFDGENVLIVLIMGVVGLVTLGLYFMIAIQVYMTLLEFYIITAFGVLFIPWGVNSHTKWVAERYMGAIVAQGTKLMVLTAIVGVLYPVLSSMQLSQDPTFSEVMSLCFGTATIAFVVWRAPSVAGGLMSGSANLDAVDAMGTAASAGAMIGGSAGVMAAKSASTVSTVGGGGLGEQSGGNGGAASAAAAASAVSKGSSVTK